MASFCGGDAVVNGVAFDGVAVAELAAVGMPLRPMRIHIGAK